MSMFGMVSRRIKKIFAWIIAIGILGLLAAGVFYVAVVMS